LTRRLSDYVLARDAGISGGRAVIFDNAGRQLAEVGCAWTYDAPPDIAPWGREFDADHFWPLLCEATREAIHAADVSPERIAGVGLDVHWVEPLPPNSPWLALPNVILTPHIGGATGDVVRHHSEMIVADVERWLRGERPVNLVMRS